MTTFADLAPHYDAVLSDVWGVVHNGVAPHPIAVDALRRYRAQGGRVVLITNAPTPAARIVAFLDELGIARDSYDALVSSGDATRDLLKSYVGQVVHPVGPRKWEEEFYAGLDVVRGNAEDAAVVVVADVENLDDTPEMYEDRIRHWLSLKLPLICANPDRVREHGDRIVYCGGAVADLYEAQGGQVVMVGKPYRPIYDLALHAAKAAAGRALDTTRILAIGDSVRTDATGAANAGLDFLFITGSVHAHELDAFGSPDPEAIRMLVAPSHARLVGAMPLLAW